MIVREEGHYYGNCIAFDPPDTAPVGMDNKVMIIYCNIIRCISSLFLAKGENRIANETKG